MRTQSMSGLVFLLSFMLILQSGRVASQPAGNPDYTSHFVEVKGLKVHYLDFGGQGLPVILVHSLSWDASTYKDFGPMLNDHHRVLAITRPGYGASEKGRYDIPSQGEYLIAFADVMGIDRAVYMGNSSASSILTYLGENHPDRVAGIVYFSGIALPELDVYQEDSTRAREMFLRAAPGKANKEEIANARKSYRPRYLLSDTFSIEVPALVFLPREGSKDTEVGAAALLLVGSPLMEEVRNELPASPTREYLQRVAGDEAFRNDQINSISDSVARNYFKALATDSTLQKKVYDYYLENVLPAERSARESFLKAYGDQLHRAKLDVTEIIGYEYRDSPELIIDHVKAFLTSIKPGGKTD